MHRAPTQFPAAERHRLVDEARRKRQPVEVIIERMRLRPGETVADLGAGVGYLSIPLADAGAQVIALDAQQEMLATLRERDGGSERIRLLQTVLPRIPLPDSSLDRAVLLNVLHEVEDKPTLAQEVRRVLRPGGRLTVVDWQARSTERGPPLHERVPRERVPSLFPEMVLERGYEDDNYYHLELRKA